jgi:hypothetical protein
MIPGRFLLQGKKKRKEKQLFNFYLFITLDKAHGPPPQALP